MPENEERIPRKPSRKRVPAQTAEARENQMISLAVDLAEKQLLEGTASSQVITHFLKLGSSKERLEKKILEEQVDLLKAKTEALQSARRAEELFADAMKAFAIYRGDSSADDQNVH